MKFAQISAFATHWNPSQEVILLLFLSTKRRRDLSVVEGTSQPVTVSKKWKNPSSTLGRKRTWVSAGPSMIFDLFPRPAAWVPAPGGHRSQITEKALLLLYWSLSWQISILESNLFPWNSHHIQTFLKGSKNADWVSYEHFEKSRFDKFSNSHKGGGEMLFFPFFPLIFSCSQSGNHPVKT